MKLLKTYGLSCPQMNCTAIWQLCDLYLQKGSSDRTPRPCLSKQVTASDRLTPVAFLYVLHTGNTLKTSFDFTINEDTFVRGIALIHPNHEDAYNFMTDECHLQVMANGSAAVEMESIGDFISDAGQSYLTCEYI